MGAIDAASMGRAHGGWSEDSPMGVYLRRSGFPPEELAESFKRHPGARFSGQMIEYAPLHEGDVIEIAGYRLEVIDTPGHTFGHISLYDRAKRLFIAGDHILGDITPNIQAWADDHDPLGLYLDSITKVEALDVDLCLPGHRSLIHDFRGRCRELREHHEVRGQEVVDILRANGGRNAYETAALMTWGHPRQVLGGLPDHAALVRDRRSHRALALARGPGRAAAGRRRPSGFCTVLEEPGRWRGPGPRL